MDQKSKPSWEGKDDLYGARQALERADFDEAERILRKLLEKQPHFGAAHERLGYLLLQKDKLEESLQHYQQAAAYQPDGGQIAAAIGIIERRMATTRMAADR